MPRIYKNYPIEKICTAFFSKDTSINISGGIFKTLREAFKRALAPIKKILVPLKDKLEHKKEIMAAFTKKLEPLKELLEAFEEKLEPQKEVLETFVEKNGAKI